MQRLGKATLEAGRMEGSFGGGVTFQGGLLGKVGGTWVCSSPLSLRAGEEKGQECLGQSNKVASDVRVRSWHSTPRAVGTHGRI